MSENVITYNQFYLKTFMEAFLAAFKRRNEVPNDDYGILFSEDSGFRFDQKKNQGELESCAMGDVIKTVKKWGEGCSEQEATKITRGIGDLVISSSLRDAAFRAKMQKIPKCPTCGQYAES